MATITSYTKAAIDSLLATINTTLGTKVTATQAAAAAPVQSVNGQTGAVVVSGGGSATTDASLLTSGILAPARIGDASIVLGKLAAAVQTSLGKADTALQSIPDGSITAAKVAADVATQAELDNALASVAGLPKTVVNRTIAYTAAAGDFVKADTTSAGFTVTLPTAPATGALVAVKKVSADTNTLTITAAGGGSIDGAATQTTSTQNAGIVVEHVGSNVWHVVASMTTTGPAGPAGAAGLGVVQDEGTSVTARSTINFAGAGVTVTDDSANSRTLVTIPGGGSSGSAQVGHGIALEPGRWGALVSGSFGGPQTMTEAEVLLLPIYFAKSTTVTGLGMQVWTAGTANAVLRFGLYSASASGAPGALLIDGGTVAATSTGLRSVGISQAVTAGALYYFAVGPQGAPTTPPAALLVRQEAILQGMTYSTAQIGGSNMFGYALSGITGALPASASAYTTAGMHPPRIFVGS